MELRYKHDRAGDTSTLRVRLQAEGPTGAIGAAGIGSASGLPEGIIDAQGWLKAADETSPYQLTVARVGSDPLPPVHTLRVIRNGLPVASVTFRPVAEAGATFIDVNALYRAGKPQLATPDQLAQLVDLGNTLQQVGAALPAATQAAAARPDALAAAGAKVDALAAAAARQNAEAAAALLPQLAQSLADSAQSQAQALALAGAARYPTVAQREAAAPANGTLAYTIETNELHERVAGAWVLRGDGLAARNRASLGYTNAGWLIRQLGSVQAGLQAALNIGGQIVVPQLEGEFSSLVFSRPVHLIGEGTDATILHATMQECFEFNTDHVTIEGMQFASASQTARPKYRAAAGNYGWYTLRDVLFDGVRPIFTRIGIPDYRPGQPASTTGTDVSHDVTLERVEVRNTLNEGIVLGGVSRADLTRCYTHDNGAKDGTTGEGVKVFGDVEEITLTRCESARNKRDGFDLYYARGVSLVECHGHHNTGNGLETKWRDTDPVPVEHNSIIGGHWHDNGASGLRVASPRWVVTGVQCRDNNYAGISVGDSLYDAEGGTALRQTTGLTLTANICVGNGKGGAYAGIQAYCSESALIGNICTGNTSRGIITSGGSSGNTLIGNVAFGNSSRGIQVLGTRHRVAGNSTQDADGNAYIDPQATFIERGSLVQSTTTAEGSSGSLTLNGLFSANVLADPRVTVTLRAGQRVQVRAGINISASAGGLHTSRLCSSRDGAAFAAFGPACKSNQTTWIQHAHEATFVAPGDGTYVFALMVGNDTGSATDTVTAQGNNRFVTAQVLTLG